MRKRFLGNHEKIQSLEVSALGLGCMSMSQAYGKLDDAESIKTLHRALDLGITFIDTADMYGDGHNEALIGKAIAGRRDNIVLATKCGFIIEGNYQFRIDGSAAHIHAACDASLRRLNVDMIDLYYLHRADRNVPIEESVAALADLIKQGKIRAIGLSEVTPATLRRANKIHPITALQTEYSLWHRKPELEILPACRELGIGFVPYSPLGRGFLTGKINDVSTLDPNDFRRIAPKFQGDNFAQNLKIAETVRILARAKNCTPAQFALAWLLAQGEDIVPIPGTKKQKYLAENLGALDVVLTRAELQEIDQLFPRNAAAGEQYPEHLNFEV